MQNFHANQKSNLIYTQFQRIILTLFLTSDENGFVIIICQKMHLNGWDLSQSYQSGFADPGKVRWPVQLYDVEGFRSHWPISSNESVGAVKNAEKVPLGLSKKLLIKPGDPRHDVGKHPIRQCYQCQTQQLTNEKQAVH